MGPFNLMHQAIDRFGDLSTVRRARRAAYERKFATLTRAHLFHGVFDSFEAAVASAPSRRSIGYDNPASARMYEDRLDIDDYDYPAMFWLSDALAGGMTSVVDVGGSVGIKYFAFAKRLRFPAELRWRVVDVPAVAEHGARFAAERGAAERLTFSSRLADADGADVLLASGSLQYLPQSLGEILRGLAQPPRRLVVNTTPIHPSRSFFTLNNIGTAICAYRVQSFDAFVGDLQACGYEMRDHWRNPGKRMPLPFEPGCSISDYSGFCFDRRPQ